MPLSSNFVKTNGAGFLLDGRPFQLVGANNYYLGFAPDAVSEAVFKLAEQLGLNVLRTWAFLDCEPAQSGSTPANAKDGVFFHYWDAAAGRPAFNDGPNGLERLDRTIALAEQYGMRLILPVVNYWDDFGGMTQYLSWFGLKGRDQFYRNAAVKQAYRGLRRAPAAARKHEDRPALHGRTGDSGMGARKRAAMRGRRWPSTFRWD